MSTSYSLTPFDIFPTRPAASLRRPSNAWCLDISASTFYCLFLAESPTQYGRQLESTLNSYSTRSLGKLPWTNTLEAQEQGLRDVEGYESRLGAVFRVRSLGLGNVLDYWNVRVGSDGPCADGWYKEGGRSAFYPLLLPYLALLDLYLYMCHFTCRGKSALFIAAFNRTYFTISRIRVYTKIAHEPGRFIKRTVWSHFESTHSDFMDIVHGTLNTFYNASRLSFPVSRWSTAAVAVIVCPHHKNQLPILSTLMRTISRTILYSFSA
ncbi:hypothetical protein BDZ89DRAFT_1149080 [Hymenopellis radicata]|nr:hypothetical protein BDZ89DRAFT_1149080 [Hymenopellis radicata]